MNEYHNISIKILAGIEIIQKSILSPPQTICFCLLQNVPKTSEMKKKKPQTLGGNEVSHCGFGARDWIRTSTSLRTLRPEHSASTNFATRALLICVSGAANVGVKIQSTNNKFQKTKAKYHR